jgi:hypothetical protein
MGCILCRYCKRNKRKVSSVSPMSSGELHIIRLKHRLSVHEFENSDKKHPIICLPEKKIVNSSSIKFETIELEFL